MERGASLPTRPSNQAGTQLKLSHDSEHAIQKALVDYLTVNCRPDVYWFSIPNGGLRNMRVAIKLKAEGLKPGVADLCFMLPNGRAAWLELKTKIGRLSDHQEGFKARCTALGHLWAMARSVEEAIPHLAAWNVLRRAQITRDF